MVYRPLVEQRTVCAQKGERGSVMVEFMLSTMVWVPLLFGTIVFGVNLVRAIQVSQLSRDTGHMYAYGIDFTQRQNTALLTNLASSLSAFSQTPLLGGVLLSKVTYLTQSDCAAANMSVCNNTNQYVFTSLYVFGNSQYAKTKLGSPAAAYYTNGTSIQAATYLTDVSLRATSFPDIMAHSQSGQYAYVSEVSIDSQALTWSAFSKTGSYARSIF